MVPTPPMWDASHMTEPTETPLQRFIRKAIAAAPRARDHYDRKIQELAGTTGKPLYDLQRGKSLNPSVAMLAHMATALGQPLRLLTDAANGSEVDPITTSVEPLTPLVAPDILPTRNASADDGTVEVISLDLSISMGPGTLVEDMIEEEPVKWDMGLLRVITRSPFHMLRQVRGIGDSMEPTLRTGDRVLIDTSERMLSRMHGLYWIDHYGAHALKRLRAAGNGRIVISSDNKVAGGADFEVDAEELRIHGRAIWFGREL